MDYNIPNDTAQTLNKFMTNEHILFRVNNLTLELLWAYFSNRND